MIHFKQMVINSNFTNHYLYDNDLLMAIRDQINQSEKNLGQIDFPNTNTPIELSKAAFLYRNAVVEKGILYVDIETIHTPSGITFRRLLESDIEIVYKPAGMGRHDIMANHMGIEQKKIDKQTYQFISVCAIISEQTQ